MAKEKIWLLTIEQTEDPYQTETYVHRTKKSALQHARHHVEVEWEPDGWEPPMTVDQVMADLDRDETYLAEEAELVQINEVEIHEEDEDTN
jgi:hypothetical protein